MFCPKCDREFEEGTLACPDCELTLVEDPPEEDEAPDWTRFAIKVERLVRSRFRFLVEEESFSKPVVEFERDLYIAYRKQGEGLEISVVMERDFFLPSIEVQVKRAEGVASEELSAACAKLGIPVARQRFPAITDLEALDRESPSHVGSYSGDQIDREKLAVLLGFHDDHKGQIAAEVSPYINEFAGVIKRDLARIIELARSADVAMSLRQPRSWHPILRLLVPLAIAFLLLLRYCLA